MIDTLATEPLESAVLEKMSFDEKKILLGAVNGVIDRHHAEWLLAAEKRKQHQIINANNKPSDTSSKDASKKKKSAIELFYAFLGIGMFFVAGVGGYSFIRIIFDIIL